MIKNNKKNQDFAIICAWKVYLTQVTAPVHLLNILDTLDSFLSQWSYLVLSLQNILN